MKKLSVIVVIVCIGGAFWFWGKDRLFAPEKARVRYRTAPIEKRDLANSVSATGELSALITVEVGSEVSGQIKELRVDFNSQVEEGQIIAEIDPKSYETLVRQSEAELAMSKANLETQKTQILRYVAELDNAEANYVAAVATEKKSRASLENARLNFKRQKALVEQDFVSRNDFDSARTSLEEAEAQMETVVAQVRAAKSKVASAKAGLAIARSSIKEAEAQVQLKEASLDKRRVDLENTIIRSPVSGVVIDRSVDAGQTVAASLQAPTLFTIAKDLRKMQVSASVDEADIGQIKEGQPARFTVDAYGARKFFGKVTQVRKMGQTVQNVVTYEVIISADNPDLSLMPGMTADVEIELVKKNGVLSVPNAALRFTPQDEALKNKSGVLASGSVAPPAGGSSGGRMDPEERIRRMTEQLNLSDTQADELRAKFSQMRDKFRAAMASSGGGPPVHMGDLRERIRKETRAAILSVLTTEQREQYEAMVANGRPQTGTIWRLGGDGEPEPVQVVIGVTDATHTEISGKGVEEGMMVITGIE